MLRMGRAGTAWIAALAAQASAWGTNFPETEPNDSKTQADLVAGMASGDTVTGVSSSALGSGLDYYRIRTAAATPGVYRHRLTITSPTPGHTGSIRGLTQASGTIVGVEVAVQTTVTTSTPPRYVQWYGFGRQEEIYFRITGATTTTQPYTITLETVRLSVPDLGIFAPGPLAISTVGQGHNTDTELWVYDAALNAIQDFGNDDAQDVPVLQSTLTRSYPAGRYYVAVSRFNLANNLTSPADDAFRSGNVLDFPNALCSGSISPNLDVSFEIDSANQAHPFEATLTGVFDAAWFSFTVGDPNACQGYLRGDASGDGTVNNFDIDALVLALTDPATYTEAVCNGNPACRVCRVDLDRDGLVTNFDIDPFVACLSNLPPGGQPCP